MWELSAVCELSVVSKLIWKRVINRHQSAFLLLGGVIYNEYEVKNEFDEFSKMLLGVVLGQTFLRKGQLLDPYQWPITNKLSFTACNHTQSLFFQSTMG